MSSLSGGLFQLDQVLDTIVHLLDGLELGQTQTSLVGDVVDAAGGFRVLAVDTTDLELQAIADGLEVWAGGGLGQLDVDGGADGGSQVGWAEGEPAETVVAGEGSLGLDGLGTLDQTLKDNTDVATVLHGDDTQVIFFVDPDQEGLVVVVVDTTASGPETAGVGGLQEAVTFFELKVGRM